MPIFRNAFTGKGSIPVLKGKNTNLRFKKSRLQHTIHCV